MSRSYRKRAISRPKNTTWPLRIRFRASPNENQSARSTSGNSCWRPDFGGYSIEKVLLRIAWDEQSPSTAQTRTIFPPGCFI